MTDASDHAGLRFVFALFLGLMLTTFIGVGVATFRPSPADGYDRQMMTLQRERGRIETATPEAVRTAEDRRALQAVAAREGALQDEKATAMRHWLQATSIILVVFATLVMAIAVWRAERLPVIGNGLLLGGVFTMLYGAGMAVIATDTVMRFLVISGALAVTILLGYRRFVARPAEAMAPPAPGSIDEGLTRRVEALEARLREVGELFGRRS